MGMDVYGRKPLCEEGEYFRNNVWWWRPLWVYVCSVARDIIPHEVIEGGQFNDGLGLNEEQSKALAHRLNDEIWHGRTAEYARKYTEELSKLPREDCKYCNTTGIRTDTIGVENHMPDKELEPEVQILTGRTHGWCNVCRGVGTVENFAISYTFSIENVIRFADFCEKSGGFSIC